MGDSRQLRQVARQLAISEAVMAEGSVRIEQLAERFETSVMTIHRDLDELESRGILRKSRGVASATSTSLVESSDVYRANRQSQEKAAIAAAAMRFIEPGQAIFLDDSTTVLHLVKHLPSKTPITVITNVVTVMNQLTGVRDLTLLGLGGQYYSWCSSFMGRMTTQSISQLRADTVIMSTSAITDDVTFHQFPETVDTKRAMFDASKTRILLVDHTKFERRALHALAPLSDFDIVIVDDKTPEGHVTRLRSQGINVVVAPTGSRSSGGVGHEEHA
ncbi:DeoR/GlpR family DNA-binding transcription regulator [Lysinimonas soli]|uniref:DeoR/GlpR family DNA-binding transcription regulator n=1 Tax=Lysinimonas soli TaxID=1074233 RepID=A0ABW0NLA4_9MICO